MEATADVRYWPGLDGVRAGAIFAVLLCHVGLLRGGAIGVDMFFVLSGFLITALLIKEFASSDRIAVWSFYLRRILRLVPAVVVVTIVAWVVGVMILPSREVDEIPRNVGSVLLYAQNFNVASGHGIRLLDQYWSLSLEEQFYFLWPLALLLLLPRVGLRRLAGALFAVALLASAWGWFLLSQGESLARLQTMMDTRGVGLFVGCALAFAYHSRTIPSGVRFQRSLSWAAVAGVLVLVLEARLPNTIASSDRFAMHGGLLVASLATAAVIAHVVTGAGTSLLVRLLRQPVMILIGKWSYGLYLVHKVVYTAMLELHLSRPAWIVLSIAGSFVAAAALYYAVELPFLRLKERFSKVAKHAATQTSVEDLSST